MVIFIKLHIEVLDNDLKIMYMHLKYLIFGT